MIETLPIVFLLSSLVIILTPGQDMILVMSRSIANGSGAGISTAAGVSVGLLGHTLLAALGLGSLLSSSTTLFMIIKFIGAAYLVYLGIKMAVSSTSQMGFSKTKVLSRKKLFYQGMVSNISNPKITLFYFAYLPQFIPPQNDNHTMALFTLGATFALLTFVIKAPIGYCAGKMSTWLRANPKSLTVINRLSGVLLVGIGLRLAFSTKN